jgi:hypothetical protein
MWNLALRFEETTCIECCEEQSNKENIWEQERKSNMVTEKEL